MVEELSQIPSYGSNLQPKGALFKHALIPPLGEWQENEGIVPYFIFSHEAEESGESKLTFIWSI